MRWARRWRERRAGRSPPRCSTRRRSVLAHVACSGRVRSELSNSSVGHRGVGAKARLKLQDVPPGRIPPCPTYQICAGESTRPNSGVFHNSHPAMLLVPSLDVKSVFCVFEHGLEKTCIFVFKKHNNQGGSSGWVRRDCWRSLQLKSSGEHFSKTLMGRSSPSKGGVRRRRDREVSNDRRHDPLTDSSGFAGSLLRCTGCSSTLSLP